MFYVKHFRAPENDFIVDGSDDEQEDDMFHDVSFENVVRPMVGFHFCFNEDHWDNILKKRCS